MATWNRDVSLSGSCFKVFLTGNNPNPPNHGSDTAYEITLHAADRSAAGGAKIIYHAVKPNSNPKSDLTLTGLTPNPPTTAADLAHLDVKQTGKNLQVTVDSAVPLMTYSYHLVGTFKDCDASGNCTEGNGSTEDPKIHNEA